MDAEFLRLASLGDMLKFKYVSGFGAESDIVLQPAFVRYFKQRWYVVGVKKQRSASEGKANSSAEEDVRKLVRVPT